MIRALIFDVGNVLLRTLDQSKRHAWERRLNLAPGSLEPLVHGTALNSSYERGELTIEAFWSAVGRTLGVPNGALTQFRADFYEGDKLNDELVRFIREQRAGGLRTGIISNAPPALRFTLRDQLHILDEFDAVIISGEVGVRKPAAQIYALCCTALHVLPAEAVFVDDLEVNCAGARAAGLHAVQFVDNLTALAELDGMIKLWS